MIPALIFTPRQRVREGRLEVHSISTPKGYLQLADVGPEDAPVAQSGHRRSLGKRLTVKALLRDGGKSDAAITHIDLAGTFAEHASQAGLIVNTTFPKAHQPLAQAPFMENWAAPIVLASPSTGGSIATNGNGSCDGPNISLAAKPAVDSRH